MCELSTEFTYTGTTPVLEGTEILMLSEEGGKFIPAKVTTVLATQCIAWPIGDIRPSLDKAHFLFYCDKGLTWKEIDDE